VEQVSLVEQKDGVDGVLAQLVDVGFDGEKEVGGGGGGLQAVSVITKLEGCRITKFAGRRASASGAAAVGAGKRSKRDGVVVLAVAAVAAGGVRQAGAIDLDGVVELSDGV
jgi:hypothetical protein